MAMLAYDDEEYNDVNPSRHLDSTTLFPHKIKTIFEEWTTNGVVYITFWLLMDNDLTFQTILEKTYQ